MKIMVIGSGGREHAICAAFSKSANTSTLYCAPGNAGIAEIAECVPIDAEDVSRLAEFASEKGVDLTFVGGEGPLAKGIVDEFESRGLRIIGASRDAARLESSKAFAKAFMSRHGIPTARYQTTESPAEAIKTLESGYFGEADEPVVVKADGLAAGKGVVVARNRMEAIAACNELSSLVGANATEKIVLEEFLSGREVSLLMFVDGDRYELMPLVRDHKRIGEGDTGLNTGGMGTITDSNLLTPEQTRSVISDVIEPTLAGCIEEGFPFRGILFLGLMMSDEASSPIVRSDSEQDEHIVAVPKVLEYNVRFGDPETQSILVRLESDLTEICEAMLDGTLNENPIRWRDGNSACVVLAAEGYPQRPRKGDPIEGLRDASIMPNVIVFHAGTVADGDGEYVDSKFLTSGGRVLGVTAVGDTLDEALGKSYAAVSKISWPGMQYRRDIGK